MVNINAPVQHPSKTESEVIDKGELATAFGRLTDDEKQQFYEDCEKGMTPEQLRQALHQKIRQLWQE